MKTLYEIICEHQGHLMPHRNKAEDVLTCKRCKKHRQGPFDFYENMLWVITKDAVQAIEKALLKDMK